MHNPAVNQTEATRSMTPEEQAIETAARADLAASQRYYTLARHSSSRLRVNYEKQAFEAESAAYDKLLILKGRGLDVNPLFLQGLAIAEAEAREHYARVKVAMRTLEPTGVYIPGEEESDIERDRR